MDNLKSNFSLVIKTPEYILIRDNASITQTMSITNDAENAVAFLNQNSVLIGNAILYYIDTEGRVDILEHDGNGKFIGFKPGFDNEDEFFNSRGGQ